MVTPEEMAERIAARQALVLTELARALAAERQVRQQVAASDVVLQGKRRPEPADVGGLANAERGQRQVRDLLTSRSEGVPMQVLGVLADLENNGLNSPDVKRWMQRLLARLDELGREELPAVAVELTAAVKTAEIQLESPGTLPPAAATSDDTSWRPTPAAEVRNPLLAAAKHQDAIIQSLEKLLGELSQWDRFRAFHRDIAQLSREQEELARRCVELGQRTLGKDLQSLPAETVAELKLAAYQERELARRLQGIQQRMDEAAEPLRQSDPAEAQVMADALSLARRLDPAGKMLAAGDHLERNATSDAEDQQREAIAHLREILDVLARRPPSETEPAPAAEASQIREGVEGLRGRQERALQESRRLEAGAPRGCVPFARR